MIDHISIRNFAIIENTEVDLKDGLNIITGETGSGKSILIEAISLALGSRADSSCVRTGSDKAVVELSGDLDGKDMVIHREVSRAGKNLIKLNDVKGSKFQPSSDAKALEFVKRLAAVGVEATIRNSRGSDIDAACGQLRQNVEKNL